MRPLLVSDFISRIQKMATDFDSWDIPHLEASLDILVSNCESKINTHPEMGCTYTNAIITECKCEMKHLQIDREEEVEKIKRGANPEDINRIHKKLEEIGELFSYLDDAEFRLIHLLNLYIPPKAIRKPPRKKELLFKDLFRPPYNEETKIKELKTILRTPNYTDQNNNWIGLNKNLNELATLYHIFEVNGIMAPQKTGEALTVFYREFGLKVALKTGEGVYTVLKNITRYPVNTLTDKDLKKRFKGWMSK